MLLESFLKPKLEKRRLILALNPLCEPPPPFPPIGFTWQELCNDDCLGGDGDVVRGRFGAGLDRHGVRAQACVLGRKERLGDGNLPWSILRNRTKTRKMMASHAFSACDGRLVDQLRTGADGASGRWGRLGRDATASPDLD